MLIPVLSWVAVGASLGSFSPSLTDFSPYLIPACSPSALFQSAEAAPIRITVVTHQEWSSGPSVGGPDGSVFRIGHAMSMPNHPVPGPAVPQKAGCHMRPGKGSHTSLSDTLRKALGLPPVEDQHPHHAYIGATVIPAPIFVEEGRIANKAQKIVGYKSGEEPFLRRVHTALLELGTWEARAVAFVLGVYCNIFVLLSLTNPAVCSGASVRRNRTGPTPSTLSSSSTSMRPSLPRTTMELRRHTSMRRQSQRRALSFWIRVFLRPQGLGDLRIRNSRARCRLSPSTWCHYVFPFPLHIPVFRVVPS
jgi:hypothetical protein